MFAKRVKKRSIYQRNTAHRIKTYQIALLNICFKSDPLAKRNLDQPHHPIKNLEKTDIQGKKREVCHKS